MSCAVCPNCGLDLEPLEAFSVGPLSIDKAASEIRWQGKVVPLRPSGRLMVAALARAEGMPIRRHVLAEIIGSEGDEPGNIIAVQMCRTIATFRQADPSFDRIQNVRGQGFRWAA